MRRNRYFHQLGLNEELAATAIYGTQMVGEVPGPKYDGVFGMWFGKSPGVDRAADALHHANFHGTARHGGVLVVAGDDPHARSTILPSDSNTILSSFYMPVLAPGNVQEVLDLGRHGYALSRAAGLWVGFKLISDIADAAASVEVGPDRVSPMLPKVVYDGADFVPDFHANEAGPPLIAREREIYYARLELAREYARINGLNRIIGAGDGARRGIVASGKTYFDLREAMRMLGIGDADLERLGIRILKIGMVYPFDTRTAMEFASGLEDVIVIEDKRPFLELALKDILYGRGDAPTIVGRNDAKGDLLLTACGELSVDIIADALARWMGIAGPVRDNVPLSNEALSTARQPYFCSGCPHNRSLRVPEGSVVGAGIGCHIMTLWMGRLMGEVTGYTQMGGEGAQWFGLSHFTDTPHIFQNIGDGTYYHSGLLAVRGAVAAGVNMTFKVLFNDAVAMTGGQPTDGPLSVGDITRQVLAEGVSRCVVVSDRPELYNADSKLGEGVTVHHRDDYDAVQRKIRDVAGVTVIVYEQTCAAEKRRRRKRGKFPDPAKRMFINSDVCEGCGDCSVKSNCVSVWPLETEMGRKRQIDQSNCNKDYSCVKGFCPSFITVLDAQPRKPEASALAGETGFDLPEPVQPSLTDGTCNIIVSGIGGTGVVTIGALLGMAAHLEGKAASVFDMTGLSQKNGAVFSHVRIAADPNDLAAQKLGMGEADVALAFDAVAGLSKEPAITLNAERTRSVVNARVTPTPAFQRNPDLTLDEGLLIKRLEKLSKDISAVDATGLGLALLGDTIAANLFMLGYACQLGLIPLSPEAILRAVEINGVATKFNRTAFTLGRLQAVDPERVAQAVKDTLPEQHFEPLSKFEDIVAHRTKLLTAFQDADYAARYNALVSRVAAAEQAATPGQTDLAVMVARNFAKLMAYKDEYEVARLHTDPAMRARLEATFEPGARYRYNLAPPLFAKRDPAIGELQKREFGPWVFQAFRLLARMKGLRGSRLDIFGYTEERRMERRLIDEYEARMLSIADALTASNHALAVQIASVPAQIRGFGHVKEANVAGAEALNERLMAKFNTPEQDPAEPESHAANA
ncbi:MAG: indolepyruvate ferredoxin oxidoreductase family protein [Novosphingobium sp.]|nr:indolepyruvate ferredoxin oxidoreductase family protein [Novosphingobium sp.]